MIREVSPCVEELETRDEPATPNPLGVTRETAVVTVPVLESASVIVREAAITGGNEPVVAAPPAALDPIDPYLLFGPLYRVTPIVVPPPVIPLSASPTAEFPGGVGVFEPEPAFSSLQILALDAGLAIAPVNVSELITEAPAESE